MMRFVEKAYKAGMRVVAGSHVYGVRYADFGWSYQREMELLAEAGIPPLEVIRAGTMAGARYLGSDQRLGSIEPGKLADLILVDGDPDRIDRGRLQRPQR
jgi:imidazolonepropionase-like amidohydrolase